MLVSTSRPAPWSSARTHPPALIDASLSAAAAPKLRVAFIGGRGVISRYSGIENYYEEVGARLARMGHEVTVYCRTHFTPRQSQHNGMRLVRMPTVRCKHLETLLHTALSTAHTIFQRYDVVHYHALGPALFSFIPRLFGARTAVTVQGLDWQRKKWGRFASALLRLGERASVSFPNLTMVVSKSLKQRYESIHGVTPVYIPNGGLLRHRTPAGKIVEWNLQPGNYILFLGRFSPEKGCHLLVEAFEQIERDDDTGLKLVLAGSSSYCDEYSRQIKAHSSERILILDPVCGTTLDELLTNATIFVLPSDLEGLSLALLDAMGAGVCVLASDVPENREVVDGAGYTFRRGDVADLADRLRFLLANPSLREATGNAARRRIQEQYQWNKIAADIETAYFEMIGMQPMPAAPRKPNVRAAAAGKNRQTRQAG